MSEKYDQLKSLIHEISDIYNAMALLGWDQQVNMPHGGAEDRKCGGLARTVAAAGRQALPAAMRDLPSGRRNRTRALYTAARRRSDDDGP